MGKISENRIKEKISGGQIIGGKIYLVTSKGRTITIEPNQVNPGAENYSLQQIHTGQIINGISGGYFSGKSLILNKSNGGLIEINDTTTSYINGDNQIQKLMYEQIEDRIIGGSIVNNDTVVLFKADGTEHIINGFPGVEAYPDGSPDFEVIAMTTTTTTTVVESTTTTTEYVLSNDLNTETPVVYAGEYKSSSVILNADAVDLPSDGAFDFTTNSQFFITGTDVYDIKRDSILQSVSVGDRLKFINNEDSSNYLIIELTAPLRLSAASNNHDSNIYFLDVNEFTIVDSFGTDNVNALYDLEVIFNSQSSVFKYGENQSKVLEVSEGLISDNTLLPENGLIIHYDITNEAGYGNGTIYNLSQAKSNYFDMNMEIQGDEPLYDGVGITFNGVNSFAKCMSDFNTIHNFLGLSNNESYTGYFGYKSNGEAVRGPNFGNKPKLQFGTSDRWNPTTLNVGVTSSFNTSFNNANFYPTESTLGHMSDNWTNIGFRVTKINETESKVEFLFNGRPIEWYYSSEYDYPKYPGGDVPSPGPASFAYHSDDIVVDLTMDTPENEPSWGYGDFLIGKDAESGLLSAMKFGYFVFYDRAITDEELLELNKYYSTKLT